MMLAEATKRVKPGTPFVLGGAICDYYSGAAIKDYIGPVMSNGVLMQTWLDDDGGRAWAVVSLHAEYVTDQEWYEISMARVCRSMDRH